MVCRPRCWLCGAFGADLLAPPSGRMLFKIVPAAQMLYTNWPSTGNSFEGAFGGYDDVSSHPRPAAPLVLGSLQGGNTRAHDETVGLYWREPTPGRDCSAFELCAMPGRAADG